MMGLRAYRRSQRAREAQLFPFLTLHGPEDHNTEALGSAWMQRLRTAKNATCLLLPSMRGWRVPWGHPASPSVPPARTEHNEATSPACGSRRVSSSSPTSCGTERSKPLSESRSSASLSPCPLSFVLRQSASSPAALQGSQNAQVRLLLLPCLLFWRLWSQYPMKRPRGGVWALFSCCPSPNSSIHPVQLQVAPQLGQPKLAAF